MAQTHHAERSEKAAKHGTTLLFCGYIAIIAPARSFRGYGGIETPMLLVLLASKEHVPLLTPKEHNRSFPNIVLDTHRH